MEKCVLYLRSSKDRSEVSLDAQRRQLRELAESRNYLIIKEYEDAVESGKDDDRPGFQELIRDLRANRREFSLVLALDTSRIARRRMLSLIFEEQECKKHGVRVVYKSIPDADPATEVILKSILQAMDEWHSLTSKAKGLAGMNENVRQGFRAGGKAPRGYKLEYTPTGALRDGSPVMKSKLVPGDDAILMSQYLKARAKGESRKRALSIAGMISPVSTLIDIERNALVYAGHTVWNRHAEAGSGTKFRDKSEWVITRDTHQALITEDEAELILKQVESKKLTKSREANRVYILAGLLEDSQGSRFHANGDSTYRVGKGTRIPAEAVEKAVLKKVFADLEADDYANAIIESYKKKVATFKDADSEIKSLAKKISEIDTNNSRLSNLLSQTSAPEALLRSIELNEKERVVLAEKLNDLKIETEMSREYKKLTVKDVKTMLRNVVDNLEDQTAENIKIMLKTIIENIVLNTTTLDLSITYRLISGDKMASPRGEKAFFYNYAWKPHLA